jgi:hypothetical protein
LDVSYSNVTDAEKSWKIHDKIIRGKPVPARLFAAKAPALLRMLLSLLPAVVAVPEA